MESIWSLERSRDNARIAGLCGALAARWRVDPLLVRICAVLTALGGGIGLVWYAAGWLWFPRNGEQDAIIHRVIPASRTWSRRTVLVIIAIPTGICLLSLGGAAPFTLLPAIIVGAIAWTNRRPHAPVEPRRHTVAASDTPFVQAARDWQQRVADARSPQARQFPPAAALRPPTRPLPPQPTRPSQQPTPPTHQPTPTQQPTPPTPPQRTAPPARHEPQPARNVWSPIPQTYPSPTASLKAFLAESDPIGLYSAPAPVKAEPRPANRRLWLVALVLAGVALAGLGTAAALGVSVPTAAYVGAVALALGLTLVISARRGRPRGLLPVTALAMLTALSVANAGVPSPVYGPESDVSYRLASEIPTSTVTDSGDVVIDLSELTIDRDTTVSMTLNSGRLKVVLPPEDAGTVTLHAVTDIGAIEVPGNEAQWGRQTVERRYGTDGHTLDLNLRTNAGLIVVER